MRRYQKLLQAFLRNAIVEFREQQDFSQEKMAELLRVSPRSYNDQEHGKYGFSAASLFFFLLSLPEEETLRLLHRLQERLEKEDQNGDND